MSWFKRKKEGISTSTREKKETPEGLWYKCPQCKKISSTNDHAAALYVCPACDYHEKIGSKEYFEIFFDNNAFEEFNSNIIAGDPLGFTDTKKYADRLRDSIAKTELK